jgi:chorismate mutase/prephenate dehydratase
MKKTYNGTTKILIENSKHGTNYEAYDLFYEYQDIHAVGETTERNTKDNSVDRFLLISKKAIPFQKANKCSMMFIVSHKPGSLYGALSIFENYELNLTKIESRKMYDKPFEYMFYVDFEYSKKHINRMEEIIAVYKENTEDLRIIGFYQSSK